MSTKFVGRQFSIGIGKEGTRGTKVSATSWLPDATLTIDDQIKTALDDTSIGVIEEGVGQEITSKISKATIEGRITDQSIGDILMGTFGTDTKTTTSGESAVYDHAFTVLQTAQHPSYTLCVHGPVDDLAYPLGMQDQLDLTFDLNKYAMYKAVYNANTNASQSNTPSFSAENAFTPQTITLAYASAISGLGSATAVSAKKIQLTFKKNTEDDQVLGSVDPSDRLNKQFSCEGSFELYYTDRTMIDTIMLGDLYKALRITMTNATTIGSSSNPVIEFTIARAKLTEVARKIDNKGIASQTVKFKAFYSLSDTEMVDALLRNTNATAY